MKPIEGFGEVQRRRLLLERQGLQGLKWGGKGAKYRAQEWATGSGKAGAYEYMKSPFSLMKDAEAGQKNLDNLMKVHKMKTEEYKNKFFGGSITKDEMDKELKFWDDIRDKKIKAQKELSGKATTRMEEARMGTTPFSVRVTTSTASIPNRYPVVKLMSSAIK